MTTRNSFSTIAIALVLVFAVFAPRRAKADLVPGTDKRLSVPLGPGNSETIDASGFSFLQQVVGENPAAKTPELLALLHDSVSNTYPNLARGYVQAVCYQGLTPVNWFDPVEWKITTPEELLALARRYNCTRIEYGFGRHERKLVVVREIPPCQRGRAECDEHVSKLETRLAVANSCPADELYDSRAGKCVKGAESEFVANLQQAVAQEGAKYAKLRNAIADCEDGRVTLDEQGNPMCEKTQARAVGIVWPWQLLALVLGVLAVGLYLSRRVTTRRFEETFANGVNEAEAAANRLKDKVIAGVQEELRVECEAHEKDNTAAQRLDALLAVVGTLSGVRPGKHDTNETALRLKAAADALGVTFDKDGNPSEDLVAAAQRVVVAQHNLQQECEGVKADRQAALDMLGYDKTWTLTEAAADVTKKVHEAAGTPKDKRMSTTLWAAVAALELNTRGLARRVRTLLGRLGRVGTLLEVTFEADSEAADEILPALGTLRQKLGIRGVGTGYSKTIPAAVGELVIAREAAEGAVESLRTARQPVSAESAPAVQPSVPASGNGHDNGARLRSVREALRELRTCAQHPDQPAKRRRLLEAVTIIERAVPALAV